MTSHPYWLAGRAVVANADLPVYDKYSGAVACRVALADAAAYDAAADAAVAAAEAMRLLPVHRRQQVLYHCARRFGERAGELAAVLCTEAGKPLRDARVEVDRLVDTFRLAAEEAPRLHGEVMALDVSPRGEGYRGMSRRVPVGPCAFISPFNFPLNLAAHKIAPAIAVGNPFVLKPASTTPLSALLIGEVLAETGLPAGAFSILPGSREAAELLVADERFRLLSFTGSPAVGWPMKQRAGRKRVVLELGGNAACVVDEGADVAFAAARCLVGAFAQSGQSCISVQRILVHRSCYDAFLEAFVAGAKALPVGDPALEQTAIGPLISQAEAERVERWVGEAVAAGARLLCGGQRRGALLDATVLDAVPDDCALYRQEVFGPVCVLEPFDDFGQALRRVNDSDFGLQAGIFTRDIQRAHRAWDELEVGGVVIGDIPSWRADNMPYGGVKASGLGREGVRCAMEEMSEIRMLVLRLDR